MREAIWTAVIVFWNVPAGFNASVVSNTAGALLPALYLLSSLMVWSVILRPLPSVQPAGIGSRGWFGLISERSIRRSSTRSVRGLIRRIEAFVEHHDRDCTPFRWTATADSILAKLERLSQRISGTAH